MRSAIATSNLATLALGLISGLVAAPTAMGSTALTALGESADAPATPDLGRWQGAWIVRGADYPGSVQAWAVHGKSVTIYDPATGKSREQSFALASPCRLVHTESSGGDGEVVTTNTFAFASDGLHVGPPQAAGGLRRGSVSTACIGDDVYTYDSRTHACQKWPADMRGPPMPAQAECTLNATPPAFVLRFEGVGEDVRMQFSGDALLSPALAGAVTERQPSFDAAIQRAKTLSRP